MYVPEPFRPFREADATFDVIAAHSLATLVVTVDGRIEANHVPVVVDRERGEHGALRFHLARPNPAASALDGAREALLVFTGPNHYVSPDWYASEHMVPTWNYVAVHAWGRPAPLDDAALCRLLDDLSAANEGRLLPKRPWTTDKLPPDRYAAMRRVIVGFDMPIERLESKWKLNQNRTAEDRAGVIEALGALGGDGARAVIDAMGGID